MSAFASLILLIIIAVLAMGVVAYSNYKVEQAKRVRHKLHKLRGRAEELEDMILGLDQICESRIICKLVNDDVIELYESMLQIDPKAGYLQAGLANAKIRTEELCDATAPRKLSRLCNSDAQIARFQAYIVEACKIIRLQHTQGKITTTEFQDFTQELEWYHLQVYVISNIVQGHKATSKQDIMTSTAFYKKAQAALMRSPHPDERRHTMMKQLADILFGRRRAIDEELMPESEFNPEDTTPELSPEQQEALEQALIDADPAMVPEITAAIMQQQNTPSA